MRTMQTAVIGIAMLSLIASGSILSGEGGSGSGKKRADELAVGMDAPDFTLNSPDGKRTFTLSATKGKKPVVLIFGSFS